MERLLADAADRGRLAMSFLETPADPTNALVDSALCAEPDSQARVGITPAMIRTSIGVEHPEDPIEDLKRALEA